MEIGIIRKDCEDGSIYLSFKGEGEEKLVVKDIKFFSQEEKIEVATVTPVFLEEGKDSEYFRLPTNSKSYSTMTFLIKKEGANGWSVSVDLTDTRKTPDVKETDFRVL